MINVLALRSDASGCGQYRVILPSEAVNRRDDELGVHCEPTDNLPADATFTGSTYHIRHIAIPGGIDVISFQRPTTAAMAGAIEWIRQARPDVGIVIELDDDLAGLPTSNETYQVIHGGVNPIEGIAWFNKAIQCADVLTVSTPALAKKYGSSQRPAFVVRNGVPASMLDTPSNATMYKAGASTNSDRIIGWAGYVGTHVGDPESTCNALTDVVGADRTDGREVCFRNVGPRDGIAAAFGLQEQDVQATGWLKPWEYRVALGSTDIGLVPLADTRFNAAKSAIKGLEMMAAGVPVIASALPEYVELQRSGAPLWVVRNTRKQWSGALRRALALTDGELRDWAEAGREHVRRYGTVDAQANQWAAAWTAARDLAVARCRRAQRPTSNVLQEG